MFAILSIVLDNFRIVVNIVLDALKAHDAETDDSLLYRVEKLWQNRIKSLYKDNGDRKGKKVINAYDKEGN